MEYQTQCKECGATFIADTKYVAVRKLGGHMSKHNAEKRRTKELVSVRSQPERAKNELVVIPPPPAPVKLKPPPAPTIRRSDDELFSIIEAVAADLLKNPTENLLEMVRKAQERCIRADRQRPITSWNELPKDLRPRIALAFHRMLAKEKKDAVAEALDVRGPEVPVQPDPAKFLNSVATPVLLTELFTRLQGSLGFLSNLAPHFTPPSSNGSGHQHQVVAPPPPPPPPPPAPPPEKPRKPRIAVVGLFKDQFERVVEKCADRGVELVFVDKEQSKTTYPASVQAVIIQRHSRHRWYEHARQILDPSRVFFADGGDSSVVQRVYDFTSQQRNLATV